MVISLRKVISIAVVTAFIAASVKSPAYAQSEQGWMSSLPVPGVMVRLSPEFIPAHLAGVTIHPDNALQFDFLINKGDQDLEGDQKKEEYQKLVKYFLASLTIPDKDQWVNLSPYENDRIIKDNFGKTEMGRDLLAEDYLLKQITSSLIYPEDGLGRKFWDKVYARAWKEYHTTDIPVNTFNKVWIVPDEAYVYESGNTAYILKSHLKVMLEEDYLSLKNHSASTSSGVHSIGSQVIREIILPELEKEVNEGKNFANLRQMYSGMILATWYKKALKESLLGKVYADRGKVNGVDQNPQNNEIIYEQYLKAFKKGVFNYIKDDVDRYTNEAIPRKYFSGGFNRVDPAMAGRSSDVTVVRDLAMLPEKIKEGIAQGLNAPMDDMKVDLEDSAMTARPTVLILEDNKTFMTMFEEILLEAGYTVLEARTPEDAEKVWKENSGKIDLILSDTNRPGGLWVQDVNNFLKEKTVPVIAASTDDHGDELWEGTTSLFFNKRNTHRDLLPKVEKALHESSDKAMSAQKPVIVLAEDDQWIRAEIKRLLEEEGFLVYTAEHRTVVGEVMDNVMREQGKISLLITDTTGWTEAVADNLKRIDAHFNINIPVIAMSGYDKRHIQDVWKAAGVPLQAALTKPLGTPEFLSEIDHILPKEAGVMQDHAQMSNPYGGIDFNAANLNFQIRRDGAGVPLPLARQDIEQIMKIKGFVPVIIEIKPAVNLPILSELQQKLQST